ncbi:MAG TPA: hypothetical protein VNU72_06000 [Puia sp.]|nr:hypothetical protein [Puia sp.]
MKKMGHFEISFSFEGHRYLANVSVLHSGDRLQYTVAPQDGDLHGKYGNQVIHEFPGKPLQPAFPGSNEEGQEYATAVMSGLQHFLDRQARPH